MKCVLCALTLLLMETVVWAESDPSHWCGSWGLARTEYILQIHQRHTEQLRLQTASAPITKSSDIGEIAVIEGNSTILIEPNPFDLQGKKLTFTPNPAGGYDLKVTSSSSVSGTQGDVISLGDDASKQITFTSGFTFPFYGTSYTGVFVNSDGNLTFKSKDSASTDRDTFRILTGPPRLAPFFVDLNPSVGGEVRALQNSKLLRVTWSDVPQFGTQTSNTLQMNLFKNGKIEFIFGSIETLEAITGIAPGKSTSFKLVDYSKTGTLTGVKPAVLERFATESEIDYAALIQEFHKTHPAIFDFVVIFTDFDVDLQGAFAFFSHIRNDVKGIGLPVFDLSSIFGGSQIQGFLQMGFLGNYPANPKEEFLGTNNTLEVFGQENGHRWLAFTKAMIDGTRSNELLGRQLAHWNFYMDTDASVMEGNDIKDNGNGTFITTASTATFSKLDLYIMGLLPSSAVPSTFFVRTNTNRGRAPQVGVTFSGPRVNVNVDHIIQAEGARVPSVETSQKAFKEAFIYLVQPGVKPS